MEPFAIALIFVWLVGVTGFLSYDSGKDHAKAKIIEEKGLCVESNVTGVSFKKCYKIEEIKEQ